MYQLWLAWRYLNSGKNFLNLTSILSILGMVIGVASLVVSMAVVSGYDSTLRRAVIDVVGHLIVVKRGGKNFGGREEIDNKIRPMVDGFVDYTPFVIVEAVLAHNKKISGTILEGVDTDTIDKVLKLKPRVIAGEFDLKETEGVPHALIGKGIAERFGLSVGEVFKLVIPLTEKKNREKFKPKVQRFFVVGILDLGRYEYDNRYIVTSIEAAQEFSNLNGEISGVRIKLKNDYEAEPAAKRIVEDESSVYWANSWFGANKIIFNAVKYEKPIIFFVLLIIVIAACFNIASTLFVSVLKRYRDISLLKTIGADQKFIIRLFTFQGLFIGFVGSIIGIFVGVCACYIFIWAQDYFNLIPAEVYKLDHIDIELKWGDLLSIFIVSMIICYLSTLAPARKGAKLNPIEGLGYE